MKLASICLVEDDPTISEIVSRKLIRSGYGVSQYETAEAVLENRQDWDLYIVDILLKGEQSGLQLCQQIREGTPKVPILILSALSEPSNRIEGLRLGADDYLTKPFEMEELLLRVEGMLRRRSWYNQLPAEQAFFEWEDNRIDFERYEGQHGSQRFRLTEKECMILKLLIENRGKVITRDAILDKVWGYNAYPTSRTVDNFIVKLRKRFESDPGHPRYIHSIRGVGYQFSEEAYQ